MLHFLMLPIPLLLLVSFAIYMVVVSSFLILENRSPQSTFAWLFLFALLPGLGLVVYLFFGRGWHAFSEGKDLMRQAIGDEAHKRFTRFLIQNTDMLARMEQKEPVSYKRKLLRLVQNNANSVLTIHNQLELLQNASQKYPRLLADIEQRPTFDPHGLLYLGRG